MIAVRRRLCGTGIDAIRRPWAVTPDGLPGEEPWRGAAEHMREVEPFASIRLAWQDHRQDPI